ncbi:hypothetical protein N7478_003908 [Penicillium angulare]|uniref:uncharacterized protein n=1 Tax=Penicillium angulare TaxID=116970 RepID=UPI002540BA4C|nr:uncharacterized protein N7478_003908 [Penicillium angulare]KAJ5288222.1 hypothetical protein N7478_003908 [Penicillium angulare]
MAPLSIQVSGKSTISRHPERAVLKVTVKAEGDERHTISNQVILTSNELHTIFQELSPKAEFGTATLDAPVTVFSSTGLSTWSHNLKKKNELEVTRYYAQSSFQAKFRNLATLSQVTGKLVTYPLVDINSIEWCLTDETQQNLSSESRKLAIRNAIEKANDFAEVVGRAVVPVEIDGGEQRSFQQAVQQMPRYMMQQMASVQGQYLEMSSTSVADDNGALNMSPQDIRYTGSVQVRFAAADE